MAVGPDSLPGSPRSPATPRTPGFNAKSPTVRRILQESHELSLCKDPSFTAAPLETNLFEWHFMIKGPPATPYEDGLYHGRILLPPTYPLRPPSFRFLTPSGRFEVNREICLSISGHHEESWQPAWGIRTALCAIRAFMAGEAQGQVGGLDMSADARLGLARSSRSWKCSACGRRSNEDIMSDHEESWSQSGGQDKASEVPAELQLAYKDDLEGTRPRSPSQAPESKASDQLRPGRSPDACRSPGKLPFADAPPTPAQQRLRPGNLNTTETPARSDSIAPERSAGTSAVPLWAVDAAIIVVILGLVMGVLRRAVI